MPRPARRCINLIAPPWYPLPPQGYGGIELVVTLLARELRRLGHEVTVYGADGSEPGTTVCAPRALDVHLGRPTGIPWELAYLSRVFERVSAAPRPDVIHDHSGYAGFLGCMLIDRAPVVHTVHGAIEDGDRAFLESVGDRAGLVAISESQRQTAAHLPWIATVHNAVDVDALDVGRPAEKEGYLLCLARICPAKGQHLAIEVARRTGRRLIIAGKVELTEEATAYFRHRVEPAIDGSRVIYIHNVGGRQKARLLARATALLAPIAWNEPFGLSVVEAMASGTPAIAFRRGAMRELIREGATGFTTEAVDDMVARVEDADGIDPQRCAEIARQRFSPTAMAAGYLAAYVVAAGDDGCWAPTGGCPDRSLLAAS
jgi:glycosyltransferase involved in cell wall biosynthesis